MNILIFGAGGVGSVVGGFLTRMGHDVTLIGRSWHLDEVDRKGLRITGIWGDYHIKALETRRSLSELSSGGKPFDLIFLTVKSYDTESAVAELARWVGPQTTLVSLQNGLGNIEAALQKIPAERYLAGRLIFGVELEPGVAKVTVNADDVLIGSPTPAKPIRSAVEVAHVLASAKIPARAVPNILTAIWAKVIYNCALNAICSLHQMPYGRILESDQTRAQMEAVVRECYAVGRKMSVVLDPPDADAFLRLLKEKLIPKTAAHLPSMLQDLRRGKRTDIEALNGAVVRYGRELGVPTPENEHLTGVILKISNK